MFPSGPSRILTASAVLALAARLPALGQQPTGADIDRMMAVIEAQQRQIDEMRAAAGSVTMTDEVLQYLSDVIRATRELPSVELGASPRAAVSLLTAARALALLGGRDFMTPDDVKTMAFPCLRHRVLLRPEVEIEGTSIDPVLRDIVEGVPVPR